MDNIKILHLPGKTNFFSADLEEVKELQEDLDIFQKIVNELIDSVMAKCIPLKSFFRMVEGYDFTILHIVNIHAEALSRTAIGVTTIKLKLKFLQDLKNLRKSSLEAFSLILDAIKMNDHERVVSIAKDFNSKLHRLIQYLSIAANTHNTAKVIQCKKGGITGV
jgi:hypothetical protein